MALTFDRLVDLTADHLGDSRSTTRRYLSALLDVLHGEYGSRAAIDCVSGYSAPLRSAIPWPHTRTGPGEAQCGWCHTIHSIERIKVCRAPHTARERERLHAAKLGLLEISERLSGG